jgi:hypothetical protein
LVAIQAVQADVAATLVAQQAAVAAVIAANTALVNSTAALQTQLLAPLTCDEPGGDRLRFSNGTWKCVCAAGWSRTSCDVPHDRQAAARHEREQRGRLLR